MNDVSLTPEQVAEIAARVEMECELYVPDSFLGDTDSLLAGLYKHLGWRKGMQVSFVEENFGSGDGELS